MRGLGNVGVFQYMEFTVAQIDLNARALTELTHRLLPSMLKKKVEEF